MNYKILNIDLERIFIYDHLKMKVSDLKKDFSTWKNNEMMKNTCSYIDHQLTNGLGTLCQYFHNEIYDFKGNGYYIEKSIINAKKPTEITILENTLFDCINCKFYGLCGRGCRNNALFLTGNIRGEDPISCYFSKRRYEESSVFYKKKLKNVWNIFMMKMEKNLSIV